MNGCDVVGRLGGIPKRTNPGVTGGEKKGPMVKQNSEEKSEMGFRVVTRPARYIDSEYLEHCIRTMTVHICEELESRRDNNINIDLPDEIIQTFKFGEITLCLELRISGHHPTLELPVDDEEPHA